MNKLTLNEFNAAVEAATVKKRLRSELRFVAKTEAMTDEDWAEAELLAIPNRSGSAGVLLLKPDETLSILPFEFSMRARDPSGRSTPVICDFCKTYQPGSSIASIGFKKATRSNTTTWYLCCADLACSQHVRTKTSASRVSRAHLRENITDEHRVERLKARLRGILSVFL